MNNSATSDINTTQINNTNNLRKNHSGNKKILKQIWQLGKKHLVVIDESIIEKLGIKENSTMFVEQKLTSDNTILMRITEF